MICQSTRANCCHVMWSKFTGTILALVNKNIHCQLVTHFEFFSPNSFHIEILYVIFYILTYFIFPLFSCFLSSVFHLFSPFPFSLLLQKVLDGNSRALRSNPHSTIKASHFISQCFLKHTNKGTRYTIMPLFALK